MTSQDIIDPEPEESLLSALRVPVLLILLGVLFLLEDYQGWPISRTWPILLVVWGASLIPDRLGREA